MAQTFTRLARLVPLFAEGSAATPALAAGITQNVTVTISPAMPDTSYKVFASLVGGAGLLGNAVVQGIVTKNTGSVVVALKNAGLVALSAGTLEVLAFKR